jgi:hypothetical protein
MQRYLDAAARDDQEGALPERIICETRHLAGKRITSLRRRRGGVRCLRVSAHFYSREEEIE